MSEAENTEIQLKGIGTAPGICIGKAYLVDKEGVNIIRKYYISAENIDDEKKRFTAAVEKAEAELRHIIQETPEELQQHTAILETHIVLLKDRMLYGKAIETIEQERINAEWALKNVLARLKSMFRNVSDPYFRERAMDIVHVSDRIMRNLSGGTSIDIKSIDKRVILVAADLSPAETSQIQLEWIKGFVTDGGGAASHTAIIARTLQIPAVLGVSKATTLIHNDDLIIVDGTVGTIIIHPTEQTLLKYEERNLRYEVHKAMITRAGQKPATTPDDITIQVMGNIELPEEVVSVRDNGGSGIGLYRTEFQYMRRASFPTEEDLFEKYKDVVEVMGDAPVTIRTLDANGDKAVSFTSRNDEPNPALGLRAIRYCLKKPDVFKTQLRAILRAAAFGNVRVMFPMISSVAEVVEARRLLREAADDLTADGISYNSDIAVGIMIEVPSAVAIADLLAEHVDFFSFGTNDLIQYSLAIDRGNRHVSHLYNPLHPAILRMISHVAAVADASGVDLYMCGEMAGEPLYLPILIGLGFRELSMNPQAIPLIKNAVRSIDVKAAIQCAEDAFRLRVADDIEALIRERFGRLLAEYAYIE